MAEPTSNSTTLQPTAVHPVKTETLPQGDDLFHTHGVTELVPFMEALEMSTDKEDFPLLKEQGMVGEIMNLIAEIAGPDKDDQIGELLKLKRKLGSPRTNYLDQIYTYLKLSKKAKTIQATANSFLQ